MPVFTGMTNVLDASFRRYDEICWMPAFAGMTNVLDTTPIFIGVVRRHDVFRLFAESSKVGHRAPKAHARGGPQGGFSPVRT